MFGCLSAHPQLSIQKVDVLLGFVINYFKIFLYLFVRCSVLCAYLFSCSGNEERLLLITKRINYKSN